MENKREYALNKNFFLFVIMGAFTMSIGLVSISTKITAWSVGICVVGLLFLVGGQIKEPFCYGFDVDGVTSYYVFLPKERYLWKNIRKIKVPKDVYSGHAFIDIMFSFVFEINGKVEGKQRFYMQGLISKNFKTKRLLKKYWKRNIEGIISKKNKS